MWSGGSDAFDSLDDGGDARASSALFVVILFGGIGVYLLVRLADGLIRTYPRARSISARDDDRRRGRW